MSGARAPSNPWFLFRREPANARIRLFCLPYAGGGALAFREWADLLPRFVALCPLQLPGRWSRIHEPAFTDLRALVQTLADVLDPHVDLPFAVFGHSMGAIVAFELARELRRRAMPLPRHLLVSGRGAPHLPDPLPPLFDLPDDELIDELMKFNGTPREVLDNVELMRVLLPALRADFRMCQTYVYTPEPPLPCAITAFAGVSDPDLDEADLSAWCEHTTAAFVRHVLPGDHFYLHSAEPILLPLLSRTLVELDATAAVDEPTRAPARRSAS